MRRNSGRTTLYLRLGMGLCSEPGLLTGRAHADDWIVGGGNLHNTRSADSENKINVANVAKLKKKWEFPYSWRCLRHPDRRRQ